MVRKPAVAGQFYPSDPQELKKLIAILRSQKTAVAGQKAIACVLPHAGYIYSGKVAIDVLSTIKATETYIILGPNHTGYGKPYSIMREGEWQTPFGDVAIDTPLADALIKTTSQLTDDLDAHTDEHSIEVQLPLIQEITVKDFTFVPICLTWADNFTCKEIAGAIAKSIKTSKKSVTIIASSDMTHYEPQASANRKDEEAIKAILELDANGLLKKVEKLNISMCGYIPAAVAIMAAKELGAKSAHLVSYQTSGDATGDYSSVVGYAGIIMQ
jgi:AmmeMemoRadiSam system protein B